MKRIFLLLLLAAGMEASAQDETVKKLKDESARDIRKETDTTGRLWRRGGLLNLNLSQGSLTNWASGGDAFSLAITSMVSVYAFYEKGHHSWDNTLDLNFGYVRTSSLGSRKNDDRIDLVSKYGHAIDSNWNLAGLFNFRSQLLKGYTYENDEEIFSSAFLSPAYVLTSAGLDYKPNDALSIFISPITARWVIVKHDSLSAKGLYGVEPGSHSRTELGAFASLNYLKELNPSISYKGRLDLFSNYRHNPHKIDVFMTNVLAVKLSRVLSATWNVDLIYDDDIRIFGDDGTSPAVQLKSLVGIGLLVKF